MKPNLGNRSSLPASGAARIAERHAEAAVNAARAAFKEASAAWDAICDTANRLETNPGEIAVTVRDRAEADAIEAVLRDAPTRAFIGIVGCVLFLHPSERQIVLADAAARLERDLAHAKH